MPAQQTSPGNTLQGAATWRTYCMAPEPLPAYPESCNSFPVGLALPRYKQSNKATNTDDHKQYLTSCRRNDVQI